LSNSVATGVCKAITTAGGGLEEKEKVALAHSMSHTKGTADAYYRAYREGKSLVCYHMVGKILEIPIWKKRQRFTQEQAKAIQERVSPELEARTISSGEAINHFLDENSRSISRKKMWGYLLQSLKPHWL